MLALGAGLFVPLAEAQKTAQPDLTGYRTVEQAITARISNASPVLSSAPAYLGVHTALDATGKLVVDQVEGGSPAATAGLKTGDQLVSVANQAAGNPDVLHELLQAKAPGDVVDIRHTVEIVGTCGSCAAANSLGVR